MHPNLVHFIVNFLLVHYQLTFAQYDVVSQTCPNPSYRNPYDPRIAFNKHLGRRDYPLHPRNDDIVRRVIQNIASHKILWSREVPIYVVEESSTWDTYDVIYQPYSTSAAWATFSIPADNSISLTLTLQELEDINRQIQKY
eukprot:550884_1